MRPPRFLRVRAGRRDGGQFAGQQRREVDITLASPSPGSVKVYSSVHEMARDVAGCTSVDARRALLVELAEHRTAPGFTSPLPRRSASSHRRARRELRAVAGTRVVLHEMDLAPGDELEVVGGEQLGEVVVASGTAPLRITSGTVVIEPVGRSVVPIRVADGASALVFANSSTQVEVEPGGTALVLARAYTRARLRQPPPGAALDVVAAYRSEVVLDDDQR